eukprot:SAG22_NODE_1520_length_4237_cov_11.486225_5_plen_383_part_00
MADARPAKRLREPTGASASSTTATGVLAPQHFAHLWHWPMVNDHQRNAQYAAAVEAAVAAAGPGARVLDIGAGGTALLALCAARAGAAAVYACEADPALAAAAAAAVAANGMSSIVTVFACHSSELTLAEHLQGRPVDLAVHEIFDSTLLGEEVLPALRDARQRGLLAEGCASVPAAATVHGQLVSGAALLHGRDQLRWPVVPPLLPAPVGAALTAAAGCGVGCPARRRLPHSAFPLHASALLSPDVASFAPPPPPSDGRDGCGSAPQLSPLTEPTALFRLEFTPSRLPPATGQRLRVRLPVGHRSAAAGGNTAGGGRQDGEPTVVAHGMLLWWELVSCRHCLCAVLPLSFCLRQCLPCGFTTTGAGPASAAAAEARRCKCC